MNDVRFRTAEVAKFADVTLRQLQLWEECGVAVASRRGRVRFYTAAQDSIHCRCRRPPPTRLVFPAAPQPFNFVEQATQ
jgi:hypothetical protein